MANSFKLRVVRAFIFDLVVILGFGACGKSDTGGKPEKNKPAVTGEHHGKKASFAFVTNSASTFWTIAQKGVEKGEKEFGCKVDVRIPSSGAVDEQQRIIEDLIAKKIDGMAISPIDPANMTPILNEVANHMPLVTQDSDAPNSNRVAYIGTNNHQAGLAAGEEIKKALPNGGKIMIFVGRLDAQNAKDRQQGILDAIKDTKIEVVATRLDYADQAKAKQNVEDAISANPDLAGLMGLWSYNGPAIVSAVKAAGKAGQIKIVAFDEESATLDGIADGSIESTIVQKPFEFGYQSVRLLSELATGNSRRIPENKVIDTGVVVVNKANVAEFRKNLEELTK